MSRFLKNSLTFSLGLVLIVFTLGGCFDKSPKVINVLVLKDNPPYSFLDTKDQEVKGFEIDLVKHIAKKMGKTVKIQIAEFPRMFADIESSKYDCAIGSISATENRVKSYDFSSFYHLTKFALVSRKDKKISLVEDLFGKTLSVQSGSVCEDIARKISGEVFGVIIKPLQNNDVLIEELLTDSSDALILDYLTAKHYCKENKDLVLSCLIPESLYSMDAERISIMLRKNSPLTEKFNSLLSEMKKDSSIEGLKKLSLEQDFLQNIEKGTKEEK